MSGTVSLREYQVAAKDAVIDFLDEVSRSTLEPFAKKSMLLVGPTGMGKTVTAGAVIKERLSMNNAAPAAFLWLSPAKGKLDKQTKAALEKMFASTIPVYDAESVLGSGDALRKGSVTILNWSQVSMDSNRITKDGERDSIYSIAEERKNENVQIIVIVDESHYASSSDTKAKAFMYHLSETLGYSPITIEITATPSKSVTQKKSRGKKTRNSVGEGLQRRYRVPVNNVRDAQMITKGVYINRNLDGYQKVFPSATASELVILAGLSSLEKYRRFLSDSPECGGWKNPLLLIQIPNGIEGDKYIEEVERVCKDTGITIENGKLAIHTSARKTDEEELAKIASFDSKVEVLVFKAAIALGWDCPRAKGLVGFRESKSEIFQIQTAGRILRMPEHKFYDSDELDNAFIYTTLDTSLFDFSDSELGGDYFLNLPTKPRNNFVTPKNMPTAYWKRTGTQQGAIQSEDLARCVDTEPKAIAALAAVAPKLYKIQSGASFNEAIVINDEVNVEEIFAGRSSDTADSKDVKISEAALNARFRTFLADVMPKDYGNVSRSWDKILGKYSEWFANNVPGLSESEAERQAMLAFITSSQIREAWKTVLGVYAETTVKTPPDLEPWKNYEFPEVIELATEDEETVAVAQYIGNLNDSYLYTDVNGGAWMNPAPSRPEAKFMKDVLLRLHGSGRLVWWWKNRDNGRGFVLRILNSESGSNFYPDYVICYLDADNVERFAVIEVKDGSEGGAIGAFSSDSRAKAVTLGDWAKNHTDGSHVAGLVYAKNEVWMFADSTDTDDDISLDSILGM
jgi:type III restriction enzyme